MSSSIENKYPTAATLFEFCKKILEKKVGGAKVIDQDVGSLLNLDPAECSHWKRGKKNIRSIHSVKLISDQLEVGEHILVDLIQGDLTLDEAIFESSFESLLELDPKTMEQFRTDYFKTNGHRWTKESEKELKSFITLDRALIQDEVEKIHAHINFKEAPLYLPEICHYYPYIHIKVSSDYTPLKPGYPMEVHSSQDALKITIAQGFEMKPYVRYLVAQAIGAHVLPRNFPKLEKQFPEAVQHVREVAGALFASRLLVPKDLLVKELHRVTLKKDLSHQLAETFWVSKALVNHRLIEVLLS